MKKRTDAEVSHWLTELDSLVTWIDNIHAPGHVQRLTPEQCSQLLQTLIVLQKSAGFAVSALAAQLYRDTLG